MLVSLDADPDVAAILPTLGGAPERLHACLDSLRASEFDGRLAIVVVWNDPRVTVPHLPGVTVLEPGLNLGFSGAMAHASASTDADFQWVVQDDMTVEPATLTALHGRLVTDPGLAIACPLFVNENGEVPRGMRGGLLSPAGEDVDRFPPEDTRPELLDTRAPLNWVASSGSLVRTRALDEIGGYDPGFYPLQNTDLDVGWRLTKAGWRVAIEPAAWVHHAIGGSTPGLLGEYLYQANLERFRRKNIDHDLPAPSPTAVDSALLAQVAQYASLGIVDFARYGHRVYSDRVYERDVARDERDAVLQELDLARADAASERARADALESTLNAVESSRSWRITGPVRSLSARLRLNR